MTKMSFRFSGQRRERLRRELAKQGTMAGLEPIRRRKDRSAYPLSFGQRRLWFLERLAPGNAAYTLPAALCIRGRLDTPALEASLGEVIRRHETLRATFPEVGGEPIQRIAPSAPCELPAVDLEGLDERRRWPEALRRLRGEAARPFDLAAKPLLRLFLLHLGQREHVLFVAIHHMVTDGVSTVRFQDELQALYSACEGRTGAVSPLPKLPIQYADYAAWQQQLLRGEYLEGRLAYWREKLAGAPEVLDLPVDRARAPVRRAEGSQWSRKLPAAVRAAFQEQVRRLGTTSFLYSLAVFKLLLHRLTGGTDLVVGSPFAGRDRSETAPLIGFFVNTVVLRTDLGGRPTFRELLERVRTNVTEASGHQDVPFELLVNELQRRRDPSQMPLVQVAFTSEDLHGSRLRLGSLEAELIDVERGAAVFDLTMMLKGSRESLTAVAEYASDLLDTTTVQRWLAHFLRLLTAVTANPEDRLDAFDLLAPAERRQLVGEWNATENLYARRGISLHRRIEAQSARTRDAVASVLGDKALSYRELDVRSNRLASYLRSLGVGHEDRVGILMERSLEMVVGLLGILKAGGAYVPLDPSHPAERLAFLIEDAGAVLLLTRDELAAGLPQLAVPVVRFDRDGAEISRHSAAPPTEVATADSLAYVIYTSGSTGAPKGAANTHRAVTNRLLWFQDSCGLTHRERVLQKTPVSFDVSVWELFWPLTHGARQILGRPEGHKDTDYLVDLIEAEGVTMAHFVPSMLGAFLDEPGVERLNASGLRRVVCSGEALPFELQRRFYVRLDAELYNLYGPTEAAVEVTRWRCERRPGRSQVPLGRPVPNTQVRVVDRGLGLVPIGAPGELSIGGAQLMRAYHRRPGLSAERLVPDPFAEAPGRRLYRTGDFSRTLADGNVVYLGRLDHQVKIRGQRVELGEIEATLASHPSVREAVVLAAGAGADDQRLVAFLVPDEREGLSPRGAETLLESVRTAAARTLPSHMMPATMVLRDRLPLLPNGKADRRALAELAARQGARRGAAERTAPRGPVEELLSEVWAGVLGRAADQIGAGDDFFALGGHSLLATRLAARIRHAFEVEIPLHRLFEAPTLREQATWLARSAGEAERGPGLGRVAREGPMPLSFAQQRLWFLDRLYPGSRAYHIPSAIRLHGGVQAGALEGALEHVVARQEMLRTRFVQVDGVPLQEADPTAKPRLCVVDLSRHAERRTSGEWIRQGLRELDRRFDLETGPLLRSALLRFSDREHVLLLTLHHIAADARSAEILTRELVEVYRAALVPRRARLDELLLQYADFAVWQRRRLVGEPLERQLRFWRGRLDGLPTLELPTDRPRPSLPSSRGGVCQRVWPEQLVRRLDRCSREEGATRFMTLLTALAVLLWRLSDQRDLSVGWPITQRNRVELEGLIGMLTNTLVLRTDVDGDTTFRELLARVRKTVLEAYAHQELPFEKLVEAVEGGRRLNVSPLFQVMLVTLEATSIEGLAPEGLELALENAGNDTAKFDLTLFVTEQDGVLMSAFEYSRDLFDPTTAARWLEHFNGLLKAGLASPDERLRRLPWLPPAMRWQAIEAGEVPRPERRARHLFELFARQAVRSPDALAVFDPAAATGAQGTSYGELARRSRALAWELHRRGVGPEVGVAVVAGRSTSALVGLLAVLEAGGFCLPFEADHPPARLALLLEASRPALVLVETRFRRALDETLLKASAAPSVLWLDRDGRPEGGQADDRALPPLDAGGAGRENLLYLLFTSGSTGRPKGVSMGHGPLVDLLAWQETDPGLAAPRRTLRFTPLGFDVAFQEIFSTLGTGGALVLIDEGERRDAVALWRHLRRHRVERLFLPFVALHQLAEAAAADPDVSSPPLSDVMTAGEQLQVTPAVSLLFRRLRAGRLHNHYGPTETHVVTACVLAAEPSTWPLLPPIGRPVAGGEAHVLDSSHSPVPTRIGGELYLGGGMLARCYRGAPRITAESFLPHPFAARPGDRLYRTGDLARRAASGDILFLGRADHQLKVRGFRVEPGEIEAALRRRPEVHEAVVVMSGERLEQRRLVAYVVVDGAVPQESALFAELRWYLKESLPDYMVPSAFVGLAALPLTPTGKVDRRRLPKVERSRRPESGYVAPRNPTEERLVSIFAEALGLDRVGVDDDFFELGGHSLLANRVQFRIQEELAQEVSLVELFRRPTPAGLALHIEGREGKESGSAGAELAALKRGDATLEELIRSVDGLSDEELVALLEDSTA